MARRGVAMVIFITSGESVVLRGEGEREVPRQIHHRLVPTFLTRPRQPNRRRIRLSSRVSHGEPEVLSPLKVRPTLKGPIPAFTCDRPISCSAPDSAARSMRATIRDTTRRTSAGAGSGTHSIHADADADASSSSPGTRDCSSVVSGRPRRASTSTGAASAATGRLLRIEQMVADFRPRGDGVASRKGHNTIHRVNVDNAFEVATNLHHRTVATIDATGFTSTGRAMAFE